MIHHNLSLHAGPAVFAPELRIPAFRRRATRYGGQVGFRISLRLHAGLAVFVLGGLAVAPAAPFLPLHIPAAGEPTNIILRATSLPTPEVRQQENQGGLAPPLADIPAGAFVMGSPPSELERAAWEGPQTMVTITYAFKIGMFEVTQGQWQAVMTNNPSYDTGDSNLPVEQVTWADATNYCWQLTQRERQSSCLPADWVYRLPSEAEWEYSCRAGSTNAFAYGPELLSGMANFDGHYEYDSDIGTITDLTGISLGQTIPVGQYAPNAWGLYDTHGNTWEWCLDGWSYYLPGGSVTNPVNSASGAQRVVRGGGLYDEARDCRCAYRLPCSPDYAAREVGFRVVLAPAWLKLGIVVATKADTTAGDRLQKTQSLE
jgi:formylglycine-generating enzyme required for sulfatase activity